MTFWLRLALWIGCSAAACIIIPTVTGGSAYLNYMIEVIMIYMIATTGLNIAIGYAGQFQMAQGAVMGTAAYSLAAFHMDFGWPLWLASIISFALALVLGAIVAFFSGRMRSHYLLLATFGIQVIAVGLIRDFTSFTGGVNGRPAVVSIEAFGTTLIGSTPAYSALLIAVAALALFGADWVKRSYIGLGMQAARQSERVANASGLYANRYKFLAVLLSTAYAALAGLLVGPVHTYLVPDSFGVEITLLLLIIVVVGGAGSVMGVAAATILITVASQVAQSATTAWPLIFGLFVMTVLAISGKGVVGLREVASRILKGFPRTRLNATETILRPSVTPTGGQPKPSYPKWPIFPRSVHVKGIRRLFGGVVALQDVSFDVAAGSVHGLVGPNGSGKTTLFEIISGFLRQSGGSILLDDRDISRLGPNERSQLGIGRTFQHATVLGESTVCENVLLGMMAGSHPSERFRLTVALEADPAWRSRIDMALGLVGLTALRDAPAGRLSYGQRKLLDLARVIAAQPSVVLLDEPIAGVDATSAQYVRATIEFLRSQRCTVVVVEHNMRFIMGLCDQVTVLSVGQVLCTGSPEVVASNPDVIRSYLGEQRTKRKDWPKTARETSVEMGSVSRMLPRLIPEV